MARKHKKCIKQIFKQKRRKSLLKESVRRGLAKYVYCEFIDRVEQQSKEIGGQIVNLAVSNYNTKNPGSQINDQQKDQMSEFFIECIQFQVI